MEDQYVLKIGSKGEIFPPKEVREKLGLTKNQTIVMKVYPNRLIVHKLESLEEMLSKPAEAKISYHALKNMESEFD